MEVNVESIHRRVASVAQWYHRIPLPGGLATPGKHSLPPMDGYHVPDDLTGKRVLDVGAWDGLWTFEALKRGASEVVAIDDGSDMPFIDGEPVEWHAGFDVCREILSEYDARYTHCAAHTGTAYELKQYGKFDVVFCFGLLYHLRHPLLGIDCMTEALNPAGELFVETAVCNNYSPYRGGIDKGYPDDMVMEFYPNDELAGNPTNWWCPTGQCLRAMLESAGLSNVRAWNILENPPKLKFCRGFAKGTK